MKRETYLDWLRGVAITLMVINHAASYLIVKPSPLFAHILAYLGVSLAGPIFLFVSGYVSALGFSNVGATAKKNIQKSVQRFFYLIVCWLAVNLLFYFTEPWYRGRILLLFAISSLVAWPLTLLARKSWGRLLIIFVSLLAMFSFAWVAPLFAQISVAWPVVGIIFFSEFPLWPWLGVFAGGIVAQSILESSDTTREKKEKWFSVVGVGLLATWFILSIIFGRYFLWLYQYDVGLNNYWSPSIITWLWTVGWLLLAIPVARPLCTRLAPILARVGQKAIWFYFVQFWLILTIGRGIFHLRAQTFFQLFILNLIIILILCFLATSNQFARITASNLVNPKGRIF